MIGAGARYRKILGKGSFQLSLKVKYKFKGKRYDAGDKRGYVKAIIDFALEREDLREEIGDIYRG